jgi:hypothetical protein
MKLEVEHPGGPPSLATVRVDGEEVWDVGRVTLVIDANKDTPVVTLRKATASEGDIWERYSAGALSLSVLLEGER